jgi:hypothetical protein
MYGAFLALAEQILAAAVVVVGKEITQLITHRRVTADLVL